MQIIENPTAAEMPRNCRDTSSIPSTPPRSRPAIIGPTWFRGGGARRSPAVRGRCTRKMSQDLCNGRSRDQLGDEDIIPGKFPSSAVRVAFLSGESGEWATQSIARRVCVAKGIALADANVGWSFTLPRLGNPIDMHNLGRHRTRCRGGGSNFCSVSPATGTWTRRTCSRSVRCSRDSHNHVLMSAALRSSSIMLARIRDSIGNLCRSTSMTSPTAASKNSRGNGSC